MQCKFLDPPLSILDPLPAMRGLLLEWKGNGGERREGRAERRREEKEGERGERREGRKGRGKEGKGREGKEGLASVRNKFWILERGKCRSPKARALRQPYPDPYPYLKTLTLTLTSLKQSIAFGGVCLYISVFAS